MVKNIILDVDGTLWDSSETITKSWNEVYRRRGLSRRFTVEEVNSYMGKLPSEIAEELCGGLSKKERNDIVEDCMDTQLKLLEKEGGNLYPGVFETLKRLSGRYGIFIVSNCGCGYIEKLFSFTGIGPFVKDYLCAGMTGKNKGENLKLLMEKENLKSCSYGRRYPHGRSRLPLCGGFLLYGRLTGSESPKNPPPFCIRFPR